MNGLPVHNLQAVARWVVHATNSCGLPATQGLRVDQAPLGAVVGVRQASTAQGAGTQGRSVADSVLERPRAVASSAPGARGQGQSGQSMFLRLEFSDGYLLVLDMVGHAATWEDVCFSARLPPDQAAPASPHRCCFGSGHQAGMIAMQGLARAGRVLRSCLVTLRARMPGVHMC